MGGLQLLTVAEWLQPSTSTGLLTKRWLYERLIGIESVVCGGLPACAAVHADRRRTGREEFTL